MSGAHEVTGPQPEGDPHVRRAGDSDMSLPLPSAGGTPCRGGVNRGRGLGPVVILVGPPGAGKSTVGQVLAERLGAGFRDTDADIAAAQGRSIAEIFVEQGEEHFRILEQAAVTTALETHPGVLALGGGSILDPRTREALAGLPVVFLDVGLKDAVHRVGLDTARPLLAVNPRAHWRELMERRRPLYTEVARAVVLTDGRTPQDVAEEILDVMELKKA